MVFTFLTQLYCISQPVLFNWAGSIYGSGTRIYDMDMDASGNIYNTGFFIGTTDFDPGTGYHPLTASSGTDLYLQKVDSSGALVWANHIVCSNSIYAQESRSVALDANGNIFIAGAFDGMADFDPDTSTYNLTSHLFSPDIFIAKYSSSGQFLWAHKIGGPNNNDLCYGIATDPNGNVILKGYFKDTVDFDPGPAVYNMISGNERHYILKLSSSGNFMWAKKHRANYYDQSRAICTDAAGNIYTSGQFSGTVDFDPDTGITNLTAIGSQDAYVQKLNANGDFIWAKSFGGSQNEVGYEIEVDGSQNVYVTGWFEGTSDFDPGTGTHNITSNGLDDVYLMKLNSSGGFEWARAIGGSLIDLAYDIQVAHDDFVYVTGYFAGIADFNGGPATKNDTAFGSKDCFAVKYDKYGNYIWNTHVGGTGDHAYAKSIRVSAGNEVYMSGEFYGSRLDFNPGQGVFNMSSNSNTNVFMMKLRQGPCANLALDVDTFAHVTCTDTGLVAAHGVNGLPPYTYEWNTIPPRYDSISGFAAGGLYSLLLKDANSCAARSTFVIDAPPPNVSMNGFDLNSNLFTLSMRKGYQSRIYVDVFNDGCQSQSGTYTLVLDTLVRFDSATVAPSSISGDTLFWNFAAMAFDSAHFLSKLYITVDTGANIGDTIWLRTFTDPRTGDAVPTNNVKRYYRRVVNSYDPNDKQVYPQGYCTQNYVETDQRLTYTIRFQNTGTASAINIKVLDTMSTDLDLESIRMVGSSHYNYVEILDDNVLTFYFPDIQLPDSSTDYEGSQGYVSFSIEPKSAAGSGTEITNNSGIYFDFNPPVITNSVRNELIDDPQCQCGDFDGEDHVIACGSFTWINGVTYTDDNDTTVFLLPSSQGCDSSVTLKLEVRKVNVNLNIVSKEIKALATNAKFQWVDCNDNYAALSGDTGASFSPTQMGNYAVIVTQNGCSDTSQCVTVDWTGIAGQSTPPSLSLFPNPSNGQIVFETNVDDTFQILDLNGKVLQTLSLSAGRNEVQLDLENGIYFLRSMQGRQMRKILVDIR